jgi:ferrochelatase
LEEIADEGRDTFLHAGGKEFNYLPVANDTQPYVTALARIVIDNLAGWVGADWRFDLATAENARSAENARKLGAPM